MASRTLVVYRIALAVVAAGALAVLLRDVVAGSALVRAREDVAWAQSADGARGLPAEATSVTPRWQLAPGTKERFQLAWTDESAARTDAGGAWRKVTLAAILVVEGVQLREAEGGFTARAHFQDVTDAMVDESGTDALEAEGRGALQRSSVLVDVAADGEVLQVRAETVLPAAVEALWQQLFRRLSFSLHTGPRYVAHEVSHEGPVTCRYQVVALDDDGVRLERQTRLDAALPWATPPDPWLGRHSLQLGRDGTLREIAVQETLQLTSGGATSSQVGTELLLRRL